MTSSFSSIIFQLRQAIYGEKIWKEIEEAMGKWSEEEIGNRWQIWKIKSRVLIQFLKNCKSKEEEEFQQQTRLVYLFSIKPPSTYFTFGLNSVKLDFLLFYFYTHKIYYFTFFNFFFAKTSTKPTILERTDTTMLYRFFRKKIQFKRLFFYDFYILMVLT